MSATGSKELLVVRLTTLPSSAPTMHARDSLEVLPLLARVVVLHLETQVINMVPPGHPCRFPFLFLFFYFLRILPLLFVVLRVPFLVPFSFVFVLSSCRFPFDSCIAFFAFAFASLLSLVADSVILLFRLGATPPPALLASLKYCLLYTSPSPRD